MIARFILTILFLVTGAFFVLTRLDPNPPPQISVNLPVTRPSPTPTPISIPKSKILPTDYHVFQTFNNCGPASLSMALRFYGISVFQEELGRSLRPYQVQGGDNDDKSVTLEELAEKSKDFGLVPFHRPAGSPEIIKHLIAIDLPVITRTLTKPTEDIGHYRVVKGYDETTSSFIQDDSLQNKNLWFTYTEFNAVWKRFNYEYLVLVPQDKVRAVEQILGQYQDPLFAWQKAADLSAEQLSENPDDIYARFNLSVALFHLGDYQGSVSEFEKVESQLPFRTLWYQIEPIQAYFELKNYPRVMQLTDQILSNHNRAFSELYLLRGRVFLARSQKDLARKEFEKAVFYNQNLLSAREALESVN